MLIILCRRQTSDVPFHPNRYSQLERPMSEQKMRVSEDKQAKGNGNVTSPRERRPFTPPTVQEVGELKELTQQFGGSV